MAEEILGNEEEANAGEDGAKNAGSDAGEEESQQADLEKEAEGGEAADGDKSDKSDDEGEKPEDGKQDGEPNKGDEPEGAPDEYEAFETPDGVDADPELLAEFTDYAKERNLSQAEAQKLVDLQVKAQEKAAIQQQEKWDEIKEGWRNETLADKELQDEDGNTEAAVAQALKAVDTVGGKELKEAMDLSGIGNHPAMVKAFYKISKAIGEDKLVFGKGASDTRTAAQKLYPSMK